MQQGTLVYTIITYNSVYFTPYVFLPLRSHIIWMLLPTSGNGGIIHQIFSSWRDPRNFRPGGFVVS